MVFLQNYDVQRKIPLNYNIGIPIPYYNSRISKLSTDEKMAISCYKDLYNPQSKWNYPIPKNKLEGDDCYMINRYMRGSIRPTSIHDKEQVQRYISLISSAIQRYSSTSLCQLFRGYGNPERMLNSTVGDYFNEEAFTSCTEYRPVAEYYATKNPLVETPVISLCTYPPRTNMLYFDEDEHEWLLLPATYQIVKIAPLEINGKDGLAYYIEKTK